MNIIVKSLLVTSATVALSSGALSAGDTGGSPSSPSGPSASSGQSNTGAGGMNTGGGSSEKASRPAVRKACKRGEVVRTVTKYGRKAATCVKISSGILPDDELYVQGRELAKDGEYEWALEVLGAIKDQNQPRVLNYTGYANRKAGRLDVGIGYYQKALTIDPNYVLAREYLGEGYVKAGKIGLAEEQLAEIQKRCGITCEEYKDLSEAITTGKIE